MSFPPAEVRRLARAARLDLAPGEEAALAAALARILDAFGTLAEAGGEPPAPAPAPPRADEPEPLDAARRARILAQVPRRSGDLVKVPRRGGGP